MAEVAENILAHNVNYALTVFNAAVKTAHEAGLFVDVKIVTYSSVNERHARPVIEVQIYKRL